MFVFYIVDSKFKRSTHQKPMIYVVQAAIKKLPMCQANNSGMVSQTLPLRIQGPFQHTEKSSHRKVFRN